MLHCNWSHLVMSCADMHTDIYCRYALDRCRDFVNLLSWMLSLFMPVPTFTMHCSRDKASSTATDSMFVESCFKMGDQGSF